jgi:hypothetical protein
MAPPLLPTVQLSAIFGASSNYLTDPYQEEQKRSVIGGHGSFR